MTQEEMINEFNALYNIMANSNDVANMHTFGQVQKKMFAWFAANKPEMAAEFLDELSSIEWDNYLTPKEAEKIVSGMKPEAPWKRDQWKSAMEQHNLALEKVPYYNSCALWVVMNMKMSDSGDTLAKYIESNKLFEAVYHLAVDSLTDRDKVFNVRRYFNL